MKKLKSEKLKSQKRILSQKLTLKISALLTALIMILTLGAVHASAESGSPVYSADDQFSSRDLRQEADLSGAVTYELADGQDIHLSAEGVYVLKGTAKNVTVYVEASKEEKIQIVLDGANVTNDSFPVIYAKQADKVFVTVSGDSSLSVTGNFTADGDTNTDGVIFARCDLVLNGTAQLTVSSSVNGIVCKDDLKITGGTYVISAGKKAVDANDSIRIAGGSLTLTAGTDGLHAENEDDDSLGYIYICGGSLAIQAGDDGIHATSVIQIDDGSIDISAKEGIEGTYIQINGGTISIRSSDDGINAARKSGSYQPTVEINGGEITVAMGAGDTDGIDSNGDIIMNGGTVTVTGNSTFDYDSSGQYNGGTIIANGQQISYIPNQMMGGGRGGWGGQNGGWGEGQGSWGGQGGFGGQGGYGGGPGGRRGR